MTFRCAHNADCASISAMFFHRSSMLSMTSLKQTHICSLQISRTSFLICAFTAVPAFSVARIGVPIANMRSISRRRSSISCRCAKPTATSPFDSASQTGCSPSMTSPARSHRDVQHLRIGSCSGPILCAGDSSPLSLAFRLLLRFLAFHGNDSPHGCADSPCLSPLTALK